MLEDHQHFMGPARDVPDSRMACKHVEPGFAPTICVTHHGTTDGGQDGADTVRDRSWNAGKSWATQDSIHWLKAFAAAAILCGNVDIASACVMYALDTNRGHSKGSTAASA